MNFPELNYVIRRGEFGADVEELDAESQKRWREYLAQRQGQTVVGFLHSDTLESVTV